RILDSTDPAAVAATVDDLDPLETLWIVASKSGTTTEPLAFMADAWARVEAALEARGSDPRPEPLAFMADVWARVDAAHEALDSYPTRRSRDSTAASTRAHASAMKARGSV